jgi:hypothetical protein
VDNLAKTLIIVYTSYMKIIISIMLVAVLFFAPVINTTYAKTVDKKQDLKCRLVKIKKGVYQYSCVPKIKKETETIEKQKTPTPVKCSRYCASA